MSKLTYAIFMVTDLEKLSTACTCTCTCRQFEFESSRSMGFSEVECSKRVTGNLGPPGTRFIDADYWTFVCFG